jgi:tripeptidyl-peptidase-1
MLEAQARTFNSSLPISVTAVGGTEFTSDETTETASALSGGGFSNVFKRPKYQDAAVTAYLRTIGADGSSPFNVSGRAGTFPRGEPPRITP